MRLREKKTSNSVKGKIRVFELCLVFVVFVVAGKTNK